MWSRELASDDFDEHVEAGDAVARTRLRAGSAPLAVGAASGVASRRPGTVRVVVHATAPGGDRTTVRSVRIHVARRPALPVERPVRVRARRRGDAIVVRWRTAAPARRQYFIVAAGDTRTLTFVSGRGRTRFRARLRPPEGAAVRRVLVVAFGADSSAERGVRVPVR